MTIPHGKQPPWNQWVLPRNYIATADNADDRPEREEVEKLELDYRGTLDRFEVVALPDDLIKWTPLPHFKPSIARQLGIAKTNLQNNFKIKRNILSTLDSQDRLIQTFASKVEAITPKKLAADREKESEAVSLILNLGTQLVIQAYVVQVITDMKVLSSHEVTEPRQRLATARGRNSLAYLYLWCKGSWVIRSPK